MFSQSEKTDHIFKALATFQDQCPAIAKTMKGFGNSKHADRGQILLTIQPLLKKYNLLLIQAAVSTDEHLIEMMTKVVHFESGEWLEFREKRSIGDKKAGLLQPQTDGAVLTYMSRQQLVLIFGIPLVGEEEEKKMCQVADKYEKEKHIHPVFPPKPRGAVARGQALLDGIFPFSAEEDALKAYLKKKNYPSPDDIPDDAFLNDTELHALLRMISGKN